MIFKCVMFLLGIAILLAGFCYLVVELIRKLTYDKTII